MIEDNPLYPIERYIMTKNDCYRTNKRRKPTGIQVHSVGCKGTTRERWRRWNVSGLKKCANAIIDTKGIMQTLDWDVRPWLSGSGKNGNANDWCVGFEICEPRTSEDTPEAAAYLYGCVLYLCTELCREYGISPSNIKTHCELHREGCASNHADVNHWWGKAGTSWEQYTMARLRHDVAEALGVETGGKTMTRTLKKGMSGDDVFQLQKMLVDIGYILAVDGNFGKNTDAVVRAFQTSSGLTVDGIVGPLTWSALEAAAAVQPADPEDDEPDEPAEDEPVGDPDMIDGRVQLRAWRDKLSEIIDEIDRLLV